MNGLEEEVKKPVSCGGLKGILNISSESSRVDSKLTELLIEPKQDYPNIRKNTKNKVSKPISYERENLGDSGFGISLIGIGTFVSFNMEGAPSKVMGGIFLAGGTASLWLSGYSPVNLVKEIGEYTLKGINFIKNYF